MTIKESDQQLRVQLLEIALRTPVNHMISTAPPTADEIVARAKKYLEFITSSQTKHPNEITFSANADQSVTIMDASGMSIELTRREWQVLRDHVEQVAKFGDVR